jgi:hypothetical protein
MDYGGALNAGTDTLHGEFRHLLTLLILAAGYNGGGVPQLRDQKYIAEINDDEEGLYRKLTTSGVLNALAIVCVRHTQGGARHHEYDINRCACDVRIGRRAFSSHERFHVPQNSPPRGCQIRIRSELLRASLKRSPFGSKCEPGGR